MRCFIFVCLLTVLSTEARSQQSAPAVFRPDLDTSAIKIYHIADQMPVFKGDVNAFLSHKLQFPPAAMDRFYADTAHSKSQFYERVVVQFVVCEDGSVCNLQVAKCNPLYPELGKEVQRVVRLSPAWNPGTVNGIPVKSYISLPVVFSTQ